MTRRRALLHIGTMKTGTTTLQAALSDNTDLLAAANYQYLGWPMRTSRDLAERLATVDRERNIIVSDEGLWHFCGTTRSDTERIAHLLRDDQITIIVYLRRPDSYVEAWFSQGLRTGTGAQELSTFLRSDFVNSSPTPAGGVARDDQTMLRYVDLAILHRLAFFERCFPEAQLILRPYENAQLEDGDIVSDFLKFSDLSAVIPQNLRRRARDENVSPTADEILLLCILRTHYGVSDEIRRSPRVPSRTPPGTRFRHRTRLLRYRESIAINGAMRLTYRAVQATWGGGVEPDFFLEWDLDPTTYIESSLRDLYDEHRRRKSAASSIQTEWEEGVRSAALGEGCFPS